MTKLFGRFSKDVYLFKPIIQYLQPPPPAQTKHDTNTLKALTYSLFSVRKSNQTIVYQCLLVASNQTAAKTLFIAPGVYQPCPLFVIRPVHVYKIEVIGIPRVGRRRCQADGVPTLLVCVCVVTTTQALTHIQRTSQSARIDFHSPLSPPLQSLLATTYHSRQTFLGSYSCVYCRVLPICLVCVMI